MISPLRLSSQVLTTYLHIRGMLSVWQQFKSSSTLQSYLFLPNDATGMVLSVCTSLICYCVCPQHVCVCVCKWMGDCRHIVSLTAVAQACSHSLQQTDRVCDFNMSNVWVRLFGCTPSAMSSPTLKTLIWVIWRVYGFIVNSKSIHGSNKYKNIEGLCECMKKWRKNEEFCFQTTGFLLFYAFLLFNRIATIGRTHSKDIQVLQFKELGLFS